MLRTVPSALALCAALAIAAAGCAPGAANPAGTGQKEQLARSALTPPPQQSQAQQLSKLNSAIAAQPNNSFPYFARARIYQLQGNREAAQRDFARAIEIQTAMVERYPTNPNVWLARAQTYVYAGRLEPAAADLSRAVDLEPDAAGYRMWRAEVYAGLGEQEKALADCNDAIRLARGDAIAWSERGWVRAAAGHDQIAIADLSRAIKLDPQDTLTFARRGFVYGMAGNYPQARADFDQAIRLDGNNPVGYAALAWLMATAPKARFRDGSSALAYARHAIHLPDGEQPWVLATLAAAQAETGNYSQAVKSQERGIAATPAGDGPLLKKQRELLACYQMRQPYHGSFRSLRPVLAFIYARD
jgi:tetratricopeptide (TPR) repeat protein